MFYTDHAKNKTRKLFGVREEGDNKRKNQFS